MKKLNYALNSFVLGITSIVVSIISYLSFLYSTRPIGDVTFPIDIPAFISIIICIVGVFIGLRSFYYAKKQKTRNALLIASYVLCILALLMNIFLIILFVLSFWYIV